MEDTKEGAKSVVDLMDEDDNKSKRVLVQVVAGILIVVGLGFTMVMNVLLYSRPFTGQLKAIGVIPALLIEGSLAVFLVGNFVWFSHGTQGRLAKIFGWAMFGIVALNCVVEFNTLLGAVAEDNSLLRAYSFWGVPVIVPLVIGFWKAILDSDTSITIMRQRRKIQQTMQLAKMDSYLRELGSEESRSALGQYGRRLAGETNARLRGDLIDGTARDVTKEKRDRSEAPRAVAPTMAMAKDAETEPEIVEPTPPDESVGGGAQRGPKSKAAK